MTPDDTRAVLKLLDAVDVFVIEAYEAMVAAAESLAQKAHAGGQLTDNELEALRAAFRDRRQDAARMHDSILKAKFGSFSAPPVLN